MTGERDNPDLGTDSAMQISENDTPETFEIDDPETDNIELEVEEGAEDETLEAATDEVSEVAPELEDEPEQTTPAVDLEAKVAMADGTEKTVKDLISGNMMQADYTRGKQEVAQQRQALRAEAERIDGISSALVDHLTKLMPAEPNPQLAASNPSQYMAQKAQYDAAHAALQQIIETGSQPKEALQGMDNAEHQAMLQEQSQMLALALPQTATEAGRKQFFDSVVETAGKLGWSRDDLRGVSDHRIFVLADWARKGMEAEAAAGKAREKVAKAVAPTQRKPGQAARKARASNEQAVQNLMRDDSIENAIAALSD